MSLSASSSTLSSEPISSKQVGGNQQEQEKVPLDAMNSIKRSVDQVEQQDQTDPCTKKLKSSVEEGKDADGLDEAQLLAAAETPAQSTTTHFPRITRSSSATRQPTSSSSTPPPKPKPKPLKQTKLFASKLSTKPDTQPLDDTSDLLSLERQTMDPIWFETLEPEMKKEYFTNLKAFLNEQDRLSQTIYPPRNLIYSWSHFTPLEHVKVVIVGQDPYHGPDQACGLSFSVAKGIAPPPSLRNIYKEIQKEIPSFKPPKHGCLEEWAKQGVLLLNACLTVGKNQAGSHHGKGWEQFTKAVLKLIADDAAALETSCHYPPPCKGVVFMVWGQPAAKTLAEAGITEKSPNILILRSPHPSPLSASRGFFGNGHFVKANEWLEQRYGDDGGIDWARL